MCLIYLKKFIQIFKNYVLLFSTFIIDNAKHDLTLAHCVLRITFCSFYVLFVFEIIKLICLKLSHFRHCLCFLSLKFHDIILSGEFPSVIGSYLANFSLPHFPYYVGPLKISPYIAQIVLIF